MADQRMEFLTETATPLAASLGLELWGVEFVGNTRPVVRIYVDAAVEVDREENPAAGMREAPQDTDEVSTWPGGVSVDQCAELSRLLGLSLDVEDVFSGGWVLEVSSPGLERPFFRLDQLPPYAGREIDVLLAEARAEWPGRKRFHGTLAGIGEDTLSLRLAPADHKEGEPDEITVAWSEVRKAHLVHHFADPSRNKRKKSGAAKDASGGIA